jgi:1-acyl-sn-glycerol-3-phosphate acyltransferase
MYFPVRSTFFYEGPAGVFVNAVMAAMSMYPPVMRDGPKRAFNQYGVDAIAEVLGERGTIVGFHPEGTRGKGDDPYKLLPANIGTGSIIHKARPIVLPIFTLGLINNFPKQIKSNFDGTGEPITMVFGEPLDLERFYDMPARLRTYKSISDDVHAAIAALAEEERALRIERGLPPLGPLSASAQ